MSTPVFVDLEISTQADGAQSSRDPVETETPESLHTVSSPTSLPDSTPPICHAEDKKDSTTVNRDPRHPDSTATLSTAITHIPILPYLDPISTPEVAAMSDSAFLEDKEEDKEEEDEEVEESSDSDSESEAAGDEGLAAGDEGPDMRVESLGLEEDEVVPEGRQWYFTFGRHLEELHVTWAHLEKKRTRLRTYTNISQDNVLRSWRQRHRYNVTPSQRRPRRRQKIS
ncbi:hypothetical protein Tco_0222046 [Tanacetum coccineum]